MKKFLKTLLIILIIIIAAAFATAGLFYKNASPSLIADLSKNGGNASSECSRIFEPEYKTESALKASSGDMTSSFWTSKWCLDMNKKAVKSLHYDFTGYSFGGYLKALKNFDFRGFRGVVSMSDEKDEINILATGGKDKAKITLRNFGKTKLSDKTLEIRIEEAVYKGENGEAVLPVLLRDYTASAGDKLEIDLKNLDEKNVYKITISEADPNSAPAYENTNIPQSYKLSKSLSASVNIPENGDYTVDCVFKNSKLASYFEIFVDGKSLGSAETFKSDKSACASTKIKLNKGKHKLSLSSEESLPEFEGIVISPAEDSENVYILSDDSSGAYCYVATPAPGLYSITSTELKAAAISVNSQPVKMNEIGSAQIRLNKGFNEIKFSSAVPSDLKITMAEN